MTLPYEIVYKINSYLSINDAFKLEEIYNHSIKTTIKRKIMYILNLKDFQYAIYEILYLTDLINYSISHFIDYKLENFKMGDILSWYILSNFKDLDITIYLYANKDIFITCRNNVKNTEKQISWRLDNYNDIKKTLLYFRIIYRLFNK